MLSPYKKGYHILPWNYDKCNSVLGNNMQMRGCTTYRKKKKKTD